MKCIITVEQFQEAVGAELDRAGVRPAGGPIVVGLSGGADSVALLAALSALGFRCIAAHCNFQLRGAESYRDEEHARMIARKLGATFEIIRFDTRARMAERGISLEMAARELRYEWFGSLKVGYDAQCIAVAHHRDDNVETMLINMLRGCGVRGARGMLPRSGAVVRPMLSLSRTDVLEYLRQRNLDYVTDSTNAENEAVRNRLRNIALPALRTAVEDADRRLADTIAVMARTERLMLRLIDRVRPDYMPTDGVVELSRLVADFGDSADSLLLEIVRGYGFNASQASDMCAAAGISGREFQAGSYRAFVCRGQLHIVMRETIAGAYCADSILDTGQWPVDVTIRRFPASEFSSQGGNRTLYLDAEALEGEPRWEFRHWRQGDIMRPFGMRGSKKLSDLFNDAGLSVVDKESIWLLTRNDEILWVIGLRASRHFAVARGKTTSVVAISLI